MSASFVTVLINTYNYAHLLPRAIDSALDQTYRNIEVVVVDDGSTDNTAEVMERYNGRVRYIRKQNGGQASAINVGFEKGRGNIFCLLDGDDYFYPEKVRLVVEAFASDRRVGLVYNRFDIVDQGGALLQASQPEQIRSGDLAERAMLGYSWGCPTSSMSLRRQAIEGLRIPEEPFRYAADFFLASILPLDTHVGVVETAQTAYVAQPGNASRSNPHGRPFERTVRHRAAIRTYAEQHLGLHFVTYCGRDAFGLGAGLSWLDRERLRLFRREYRQIIRADVELATKLRAQLKLLVGLVLPERWYRRLRRREPEVLLTAAGSDGIR